jgi:hypothetical protein
METKDNLYYELKMLSSVSDEARKIYGELMSRVDMLRGNDLLMIYDDKNRQQIQEDLKELKNKGFKVDMINRCVQDCDGDRKRTIFFKPLNDCRNLAGYIFRRVIFK